MINSQILIIHKFPALFNILNEIKSNLNFEIKAINESKIQNNFKQQNLLIISGEKTIDDENVIDIKNYPINIYKLIEIINVQFLKKNFSKQNNFNVGKYLINLNSRKMSFKNVSISLTEKESKIVDFLNSSNSAVTISDLQFKVWGHKSKLDTHTVETHVYRLRKKIEKKFKDKLFIISSKNGYKIQK